MLYGIEVVVSFRYVDRLRRVVDRTSKKTKLLVKDVLLRMPISSIALNACSDRG